MSKVISGPELSAILKALQVSQDDAAAAYLASCSWENETMHASAQIGFENLSDGQPLIEQRIDLPIPSNASGTGNTRLPKLDTAMRLVGEAMRLAQLIQQFVDHRKRIVWVTFQHRSESEKSDVINFTAIASFDDYGCPKTLSQITYAPTSFKRHLLPIIRPGMDGPNWL